MAAITEEPGGQSLYAEEDTENQLDNADPNEFDERPPECEPVGPAPSFELVSEFFEKLQAMRGKRTAGGNKGSAEKKRATIQQMFVKWRSEVGKDLYPLVRLILPDRDRYRATYGVKEQVLAKIYVQVLGLDPKTSASADRLTRWKQPTKENQASGDFAEVAHTEIDARSTVERSSMTIEEVNSKLDELSRGSRQEEKVKIVRVFYERLTAKAQKWLIRIILKDLKISLGEKMVLSCIHQDAIDLFNVCSDLRAVCWKLWDTSKRLPNEDNTVQLFRAFRPMLCNRNKNDFEDIAKSMGAVGKIPRPFLIEEKLDGERIQLHKKGEEYRYYSRKDKDYTYLYGLDRTSPEGSLTPFIHSCFDNKVDEIILDGEMLVKEPTTGLYLKFGSLKTTALNHWKAEGGPTVCYKIFDVLYCKAKGQPGRSLLDYPLRERRRVLEALVKPKYARLEIAETFEGRSAKCIKDKLAWILDKQGEGLVIKNLESVYTLHGREDDWIKVKPEYMDSLGEEVDVLVMGGFWGSGRRGGTISSFMCGVLDDSDPDNPKYLSFCKVGSGFSMEDFAQISDRMKGKGRDWVRGMKDPENYVFGAEKPDMWFKKEDTFLLAVKAAEITADAMNYGAEVCLRFPRVYKIRWDLTPLDCHKYRVDYLTMASSQKSQAAIADAFTRKTRRVVSRSAKPKILSSLQGADVRNVKKETQIFENCPVFYIVEGVFENGKEVKEQNKQELEKLVVANGGKRWQGVPKDRSCYIFGSRANVISIRNLIKSNHDIVRPNWIVDSIIAGHALPMTKKYYLSMTETTEADIEDLESEDEAQPEQRDNGVMKVDSQGRSSSSPDLPPIKRNKVEDGTSGAYGQIRSREEEDAETETEDDASTASDLDAATGYRKGNHNGEPATVPQMLFRERSQTIKSEEEEVQLPSTIAQSGLGAFTPDTAYDDNMIFKNLVFYLDSSENARKNSLQHSTPADDFTKSKAAEANRQLDKAAKKLKSGGGRLVDDLEEPSLTHIVLSSDTRRLVELLRRTREPRARRAVTTAWVDDSVEMEGLQEESWYQAYAG